MSSDVKDEVGEIFIAMEDLIEAEINHLNNSEIPPIILGSFNKLLRAINSSSKYYLTNLTIFNVQILYLMSFQE